VVELIAHSDLALKMIQFLSKNDYIGKLFAEIEERKVRDPAYLTRMFSRTDRFDRPLLSFGKNQESELILEKKEGYTVAFVPIKKGRVEYSKEIENFIPALAKILKFQNYPIRHLLKLYQKFVEKTPKVEKNNCLLVKTDPLYIRTVFAKVSEKYLPKGIHHTAACILEPNTLASGDIYEFYGVSDLELNYIPLEFYTLEPHREYVFFEDRDQLKEKLEDSKVLFKAVDTAPKPENKLASVFIVKGTEIDKLNKNSWIVKDPKKHEFPGLDEPIRQAQLVEKYIQEQPSYPFLKAIEDNLITSQGILLTRHFPSPLLKRMLLSDPIYRNVKGIYFKYPSRSNDEYFSHEDRGFLLDLAKFAIPTYWIDQYSKKILQYVLRVQKDAGMFVPLDLINVFRKATFFGVYGSNLIAGRFDQELEKLLTGILKLRDKVAHPLLCSDTPLALVTGGGPGAMEVGNMVAKKLKILSCANVVDFRTNGSSVIHEQQINPHIDAKMTYRLDRLVERQAEFYLDFPMFLMGGIGADFELLLEEVNRKIGSSPANPVLLFGSSDYWREKISSRFEINSKTGTIKGSEWVSNCFYAVQTAEQGLKVYKDFFNNKLPIGKKGPIYKEGGMRPCK
ncbi:MAG: hypothetical protein KR126chlam6_01560, partial [Candidatus Anoxychlamydiales bacterium]|nr:hypothetical protein [Candidatus Anoxychlamydiales bacterium]